MFSSTHLVLRSAVGRVLCRPSLTVNGGVQCVRLLSTDAAASSAGPVVGHLLAVRVDNKGAPLDSATDTSKATVWQRFRGKRTAGSALLSTSEGPQGELIALVAIRGDEEAEKRSTAKTSEEVRCAAAAGFRALREAGCTRVLVDSLGDIAAAAEGVHLAAHTVDQLKSDPEKRVPVVELAPLHENDAHQRKQWQRGTEAALAQNFARRLADLPANRLQPAHFVEVVSAELQSINNENVKVEVRDRAWMREKGMGCFLGVAQGCPNTPPFLLEAHYRGAQDPNSPPLVLVGKGVTFDSGGISIKPSAGMGLMKGDMGGAAAVAGVMRGLAALRLPINVIGLCGLTENMPSGDAIRPGDVLRAMDGTTVEVENTDAEGRLVLADVLCYAREFKPRYTVDVATLTGAMDVALGAGAVGVFSEDDELVARMVAAGERTGEPIWRLPLYELYRERIRSPVADLSNCGPRAAGACTAASFLQHFASTEQWIHMDIAGVMNDGGTSSYLEKDRMTGKPVRTLLMLAEELAKDVSNTK